MFSNDAGAGDSNRGKSPGGLDHIAPEAMFARMDAD